MKHTKGEWEARESYKGWSIHPKDLTSVVADIQMRVSEIEAEANAKLIAAAPELLDALLDAKENWKGNKLIGGIYEKICNAINKATI
jgi:hypothetical protein